MNRITHFFAKAAVRQSIQAQHARSGRMCATIFATSQNRPKIVSLDSYKNYLTQSMPIFNISRLFNEDLVARRTVFDASARKIRQSLPKVI